MKKVFILSFILSFSLSLFGQKKQAPGFELTFFKPTKNNHDFKLTGNGAKASEGDAREKLIRREIEK